MITLYARQQKRYRCKNRLLDSVGEGEGGMIWENGIETCIISYMKWICHRCTWVPNPEHPSHLLPHIISLDYPHAPVPSILYPALNIDWRFISYMIVYMFQCHSPKSSHPLPLPLSPKVRSIHLYLFCCLAYRVIITIFLNSIYMCQYTILVFFFLAYFTLYNRLQFHPSH